MVTVTSDHYATEREATLASIRIAFSIKQNYTITLQVKDELWSGVLSTTSRTVCPTRLFLGKTLFTMLEMHGYQNH